MPGNKLPPNEPIVARRDGDLGGRPVDQPRVSNTVAKTANKSSASMRLLAAILAFGLVGLSWFSWQQSVQQALLQQRFNELASKIDSTDELLSQSGTVLSIKLVEHQEELNKHWSEIKKLWGVANDRNKKAIKALEQSAAVGMNKHRELANKLAPAAAERRKLSAQIGKMGSDSLASVVRIDELDERINQVYKASRKLRATVETKQRSFENRLRENEQAIEAIDAFRRQTNQSLEALRRTTVTP